MLKKLIALLLALITVASVFAGCSSKKPGIDAETSAKATKATTTLEEDPDENVEDPDSEEETEEDDEEIDDEEDTKVQISIDYTANTDVIFDDTHQYDKLTLEQLLDPDNFQGSDIPDSVDYGGYKINVLTDTNNLRYEFIEHSDGDIIKEAVANRQQTVEEYLGVDFVITPISGGYYEMENYAAEIEAASGSGSPYDLALAYGLIPPIVAAKGLSRDLAESDSLNLLNTKKEYWGSGIKEEIMMGGRIFWMSDNSSWDSVRNLLCIFVDIEFFSRANEGFDQTDLYQMVYGGTWTMENMLLFIQDTYENTNTDDPERDKGDTYGLQNTLLHYAAENWLTGAGFSLTKINSRGTYEWAINEQPFIDFSDWWQQTLKNNENIIYNNTDNDAGFVMLNNGRAMFTMAPLRTIESNIERDYTVLPMPLYNTNIKNAYSTPILYDLGSWLIPKATKKESFERSATVLEQLAAEGNRRIAPIYFEIYLKRQNAGHDKDMQKMFNIIRNAVVFDVGFLYGPVLTYERPKSAGYEEVFIAIRRMWHGEGGSLYTNISSVWASIGASVTNKLNNLMVDILDY